MGLEISWYLRLPRYRRVRAVIMPKALKQITHMLKHVDGWNHEVEEGGETTVVLFTRREE